MVVEHNKVSVAPTAAKPKQLIAILALNSERVLPISMLVEELWGEAPPRSATTTLQTYVLQVRRHLAAASHADRPLNPKDVLVTRNGGYMLRAQDNRLDVDRHQDLVTAGHVAVDNGDAERAATLFRQALSLWRGPALADLPLGPYLSIEKTRLDESWLATVEQRIAAEIKLGWHQRVLSELSALAAAYPLHEGVHEQWILALYRSGRAWRAIDVFLELRNRLVVELGIEPSPRLRRLHQAIITSDPRLDQLMSLLEQL